MYTKFTPELGAHFLRVAMHVGVSGGLLGGAEAIGLRVLGCGGAINKVYDTLAWPLSHLLKMEQNR